MIQAPQLQYVSTQQPVQAGYQQQGAVNTAQTQNAQLPSAIYNYPTASSYMPAETTGKSQLNGVNIEIINPQGQGGSISPAKNLVPAQYYPINTSVPFPQPQAVNPQPAPVFQQPAQQQPVNNEPVQSTVVPVQQEPATNAAAPVIGQPIQQSSEVNPDSFAGRLRSTDLDTQTAAIEEVAEKVKNPGPDANALLDELIFDALVDIVKQDTSSLAGPTPEVLELRQKNPADLTEEEKGKIVPTPLEKAEMNKQFALYTLSFMHERLNNELQERSGQALELKDLPGIDTVVEAVKSNQNPIIRVASIGALAHVAKSRPEYKQDMKTIFELAKSDEDETVREAATKASENLGN